MKNTVFHKHYLIPELKTTHSSFPNICMNMYMTGNPASAHFFCLKYFSIPRTFHTATTKHPIRSTFSYSQYIRKTCTCSTNLFVEFLILLSTPQSPRKQGRDESFQPNITIGCTAGNYDLFPPQRNRLQNTNSTNFC